MSCESKSLPKHRRGVNARVAAQFVLCLAVPLVLWHVPDAFHSTHMTTFSSKLGNTGLWKPGGDAIDFRCKMPESLRLQGNCWVKGAIGQYKGERTVDGKIVDGHSQVGEDEFLLEHFFFGRTGGTFIEMGGVDGLKLSNSYFFEKQRDWRGLMIEGSPRNAEKLHMNRPKAITVNAMVCGEERDLHWMDNGGVGGAYELLPERILRRYYSENVEKMLAEAPIVPCVPLGKLLNRFQIQHVDLFSLDVEGSELSVLKTIDFSVFTASVIIMEVESPQPHTEPPVMYLRKLGYIPYGLVRSNYVLLHPRFEETLPKPLKRPARMSVPAGMH